MHRRALLLCSLFAAACGSSSPGGNDPDAAIGDAASGGDSGDQVADADPSAPDGSSPWSSQIITEECAPNDGPALRILLAADSVTNQCRAAGDGATLEIVVYTRTITPPQTIELHTGPIQGAASQCPGGLAPCILASTGRVTFDAFEQGVSAKGSYSLSIGGESVDGTFEVEWCAPEQPIVCG